MWRRAWAHAAAYAAIALLSLFAAARPAASQVTVAKEGDGDGPRATIVREGTRIHFDLVSVEDGRAASSGTIQAGRSVEIRLGLTDAETGTPLTGLKPAAWVDTRRTAGVPTLEQCKARIQGYLPKRMETRPVVDLNSYVVLGLNRGNSISVLDPFFGFGSTHMITTVILPGEGADWVALEELRRLYVTIPRQNTIAVVDTDLWDVVNSIRVGTEPSRIRRGPRGRLWIGIDGGEGGVVVIDPEAGRVTESIITGAGHHEFVFRDDGRFAYVSNPDDGTVSVISTGSLELVRTVDTGTAPVDLAYSRLSDHLYIVDRNEGTITIYDGESGTLLSRLTGSPGLWSIRFDPSGRWGFILNGRTDGVHVLDAKDDSIAHTLVAAGRPHQVAFTRNFAYVRSIESAEIMMIALRSLESGAQASAFARDFGSEGSKVVRTEGGAAAVHFPAGAAPPGKFGEPPVARAIALAPHKGDAVYVPNPAENSIYLYHYMEGMPTPSGNLKSYTFEPKAALALGRHLREAEPGVYTATITLPEQGKYSVNFLLDSPRIIHCFPFKARANPRLAAQRPEDFAIKLAAGYNLKLVAGRSSVVRFRIVDRSSGQARGGLAPVARVMSPGGWFTQKRARPASESGAYRVEVTVPNPGAYYFAISLPALNRGYSDQMPLTLVAEAPGVTADGGSESN